MRLERNKKIYVETEIKAITSANSGGHDLNTIYLFEKSTRKYFPVNCAEEAIEKVVSALIKKLHVRPNIHQIIKTLINLGNLKLKCIQIYGLKNEIYYTYLVLEDTRKKIYKVDVKITDGIILCILLKKPILIDRNLVKSNGIELSTNI